MNRRDVKRIPARVKLLITRKVEYFPGLVTKEPWDTVWAIAGVHSYNWWWVRKYGSLTCGCGRNPLTRRFVWYSTDCPQDHARFKELLGPAVDEEDEGDESQPERDQVDPGGDQFEGGDTEHDQRRDQ